VVFGFDRYDEKATIPLRKLLGSNTFKVFTLSYLPVATLPLAYVTLSLFGKHPIQACLVVASITTATQFIMFIILYVLVRKTVKLKMPWKNIGKYVCSASIMGVVLYVIPHQTRTLSTLAFSAMGLALYSCLVLVMDKDTRILVKTILAR
jgi:hypothetical protein